MAADIREDALATVRAQGGLAFNPKDKDVVLQIRKASSDGNGIAAVIDFVGSDKTFALSQGVLRRGGQAIQVSCSCWGIERKKGVHIGDPRSGVLA